MMATHHASAFCSALCLDLGREREVPDDFRRARARKMDDRDGVQVSECLLLERGAAEGVSCLSSCPALSWLCPMPACPP